MAARQSIRGAGTDRPGATDTTMLIWKVIDANPGITRDEIFAKIEHEIPAGWAARRYMKSQGHKIKSPDNPGTGLLILRARNWILTRLLQEMRDRQSIGRSDEGYRTLRELKGYRGQAAAVDASGMAAAEHLNDAYALRTAEAWVVRGSSRTSAAEREAIVRVIRAFRRLSA